MLGLVERHISLIASFKVQQKFDTSSLKTQELRTNIFFDTCVEECFGIDHCLWLNVLHLCTSRDIIIRYIHVYCENRNKELQENDENRDIFSGGKCIASVPDNFLLLSCISVCRIRSIRSQFIKQYFQRTSCHTHFNIPIT